MQAGCGQKMQKQLRNMIKNPFLTLKSGVFLPKKMPAYGVFPVCRHLSEKAVFLLLFRWKNIKEEREVRANDQGMFTLRATLSTRRIYMPRGTLRVMVFSGASML